MPERSSGSITWASLNISILHDQAWKVLVILRRDMLLSIGFDLLSFGIRKALAKGVSDHWQCALDSAVFQFMRLCFNMCHGIASEHHCQTIF